MDMFNNFDKLLSNLDSLHMTFWLVAIPTSIIFIIQAIMTFLGIDSTDELEVSINGDLEEGVFTPFQQFSLRNLTNFLLGFSWTGISFYNTINNKGFLITLSLCIGTLFLYGFAFLIRQIQVLEENNSFRINETMNKIAEVYLTIPENKKGVGKILISINGTFHELEVMTENDKILTGSIVKVVKIENESMPIVIKV